MARVVAKQAQLREDERQEDGVDQLQWKCWQHKEDSQAARQQAGQRQHRTAVVPGLLVKKAPGANRGFELSVCTQLSKLGRRCVAPHEDIFMAAWRVPRWLRPASQETRLGLELSRRLCQSPHALRLQQISLTGGSRCVMKKSSLRGQTTNRSTTSVTGGGARRVLVLMDQGVIAEVINLTLNHGVYVTRGVKNAAQAMALVEEWQPHLAV